MAYALWFPYLTTCMRYCIAGVFLAFSLRKLPDRPGFAFLVIAYRVLPQRWATLYGLLLPWLELLVGLMLVMGILPRIAAGLAALLTCSFLSAVGLNIARRRFDLACGCAGAASQTRIGGKVMVRNLGILALATMVSFDSNALFVLVPEQRLLTWLHGSPLFVGCLIILIVLLSAILLIMLCVPLGWQMRRLQLDQR